MSERTKKTKPTVAAVRRIQPRPFGWADFKHRLCRAGMLDSPVADASAWVAAFKKSRGR